jgi:cytochrome oxidase Cu insertion factor (SCO1/SenC/PrrC family)
MKILPLVRFLLAATFLIVSCSKKEEPLPILSAVPEFSLTERNGQALSLQDLRGKVWIADFIFTNCAGTCPIMTTAMTDIQKMALAENLSDVKLVSITVDPERDSLEVLKRFADGYGAIKDRWYFLTGDGAAIQQLANKGFLLSAATSGGSAEEPIIHSNRFVLVDRQGRIRGYYDGTDEESVKLLQKDLRRLYREAAPGGKAS